MFCIFPLFSEIYIAWLIDRGNTINSTRLTYTTLVSCYYKRLDILRPTKTKELTQRSFTENSSTSGSQCSKVSAVDDLRKSLSFRNVFPA